MTIKNILRNTLLEIVTILTKIVIGAPKKIIKFILKIIKHIMIMIIIFMVMVLVLLMALSSYTGNDFITIFIEDPAEQNPRDKLVPSGPFGMNQVQQFGCYENPATIGDTATNIAINLNRGGSKDIIQLTIHSITTYKTNIVNISYTIKNLGKKSFPIYGEVFSVYVNDDQFYLKNLTIGTQKEFMEELELMPDAKISGTYSLVVPTSGTYLIKFDPSFGMGKIWFQVNQS